MNMELGIFGGGQLGQMLARAALPLGVRVVCADPSAEAPAGSVSELLVGAYDDAKIIERLSACDVVSYEFESVPVAPVQRVAARTAVRPGPEALRVAQDRLHEKTYFQRLAIGTPAFAAVDTRVDLERALAEIGLPAVLKTRRFGYDGKGQYVLRSPDDADRAFEDLSGAALILEQFVRFDRELSLIAVRALDGQLRFYPLIENEHRHGILHLSRAPAPNVTAALEAQAHGYGARLLEALDYVGVLTLEMFQVGDSLLANEIAPRVHNSGHLTIEAAVVSQFENHVRAVVGWPLGDPSIPLPSAMINLVGATPDPARVLAIDDAHLHLYGKAPRPGRKLGHVTVRAPDTATLEERVARVLAIM